MEQYSYTVEHRVEEHKRVMYQNRHVTSGHVRVIEQSEACHGEEEHGEVEYGATGHKEVIRYVWALHRA